MSLVAFSTHAAAQTANSDRQFENYTQIEIDAARKAARTLRLSAFRVCADPGNMPMSDQAGEGYENKLAELIAGALHTRVTYFWRPYIERGLTRQTFDENECDVLMDVPAHYGPTLTTFPIFRSTYVLASRTDRGLKIKDLDDPVLHSLSIGVMNFLPCASRSPTTASLPMCGFTRSATMPISCRPTNPGGRFRMWLTASSMWPAFGAPSPVG